MPYWRLSGFYLFYFASIGVLVPYWGPYLNRLGFSPSEIGELMAMVMATKIVSPNIWAWIADHTGRRMQIVRGGSFLAALFFAGVFFGNGYWWLMAVVFLFSFCWNACLPQFEANTLSYLGDQPHRYSAIRLWGSVGFVLAVIAVGPLLSQYGQQWMPVVMLGLMIAIWLSSLLVPERAAAHVPIGHESLRQVLLKPAVIALLLVCFLNQASHGPYYTFYTLYLEQAGYGAVSIGWLWALGVIAEVGVFMVMHRLVPRFGLRNLLLFAIFLTAVRWWMIGAFIDSLTLLIVAQLFHAASFGIYHAVAIQLIHRHFVGKHQGRGQALYTSVSFGLGGVAGALYAGYSWQSLGATASFNIAAVLSLLAFMVTWWGIRER
ncbi:Nucleoside:H+ symporter:Major facilitator superfamily [hydrothermal vent metagenome]|uniref:Nucleoside:H+ symporter:Major facilitator superfamily n=1 Tax=hydrothermal vent metagenome TaxID=652676 RepID=A0A3B0ZSH2_9ZZZZ